MEKSKHYVRRRNVNQKREEYGMKRNVKITKCMVTGGDKDIFNIEINQEKI
ncbi:MAG: hypothetical protein ACEY3A_03200 [Wolbachia sp.]